MKRCCHYSSNAHTYLQKIPNKRMAYPPLLPEVISNKEISFLYILSKVIGLVEQVWKYFLSWKKVEIHFSFSYGYKSKSIIEYSQCYRIGFWISIHRKSLIIVKLLFTFYLIVAYSICILFGMPVWQIHTSVLPKIWPEI